MEIDFDTLKDVKKFETKLKMACKNENVPFDSTLHLN